MTAGSHAEYSARRRLAFREEYLHFRSFGLSHEKIAARMGIARASLLRQCERYDIYVPEDDERALLWRLDRLIDSGRPFTSTELTGSEGALVGGVMRRLERQGRICQIGWAEHALDNGARQRMWQATAAASSRAVAS